MRLPHREAAVIDRNKLVMYCLNSHHPRGKHKARVFNKYLGITADDAEALIAEIERIIHEQPCQKGYQDEWGTRYTVDFVCWRGRRQAVVRTCWIVMHREGFPRLTSCYVIS